jgi:membrane protein required for beta-lactamase induction
MSRLKRLLAEAHQRSLWQALVIYLGASFALVEVVDVFIERFGLPSWLFPVAVTLLLIGLRSMAMRCRRDMRRQRRKKIDD